MTEEETFMYNVNTKCHNLPHTKMVPYLQKNVKF